jgi:hypothetical protein
MAVIQLTVTSVQVFDRRIFVSTGWEDIELQTFLMGRLERRVIRPVTVGVSMFLSLILQENRRRSKEMSVGDSAQIYHLVG